MMGYEAETCFRGWYYQMIEGQEPNGNIPQILPGNGWCKTDGGHLRHSALLLGTDPWWGAAITVIPWHYYNYTGDKSLIEAGYHAMKRWVNWVERKSRSDITVVPAHYLGYYGD